MFNASTVALLHSLQEDKVVPGVSYAMLQHGKLQAESFGYKQVIPKKELLVPNMLYDIASLTKVIGTTTVIMQLIQANKLHVDDPIYLYLPEFKDKRVTIRHLLTHTSGLTGYIKNRNQLPAEELLRALHTLKVGENFEKKVVYTDVGFILLGQIIENIYHEAVQKVIFKNVLVPLGLTESTFNPDSKRCVPTEMNLKRGLICGKVHDPKAYILGEHCGSAGLFMSLHDLVKFTQWFMSNEENKHILNNKTIDDFFKDQTPTRKLGRSYGWDLRYMPDKTPCLYHTGYTGTFILINKIKQSALIVLTNRIHPNVDNEIFLQRRDALIENYLKEEMETNKEDF